MKPDLILVTGVPGSSKTLLARKLNEALYSYVHIDIGQKIIEVDCTSNYKPSLENIIKELGVDDVRSFVSE